MQIFIWKHQAKKQKDLRQPNNENETLGGNSSLMGILASLTLIRCDETESYYNLVVKFFGRLNECCYFWWNQ